MTIDTKEFRELLRNYADQKNLDVGENEVARYIDAQLTAARAAVLEQAAPTQGVPTCPRMASLAEANAQVESAQQRRIARAARLGVIEQDERALDLFAEAAMRALRKYRMSNMVREEDDSDPYPLIDLLSTDGESIATGINEIELIVDAIYNEARSDLAHRAQAAPTCRACELSVGGMCEHHEAEAEHKARAAIKSAAQSSGVPATNAEIYTLRRVIECAQKLNERPRPMCRDCADENGTCPNSGLECDMSKMFADAKALHNKLAANPAPSAALAQGDQSIDGQLIGIASPVKVATVVSRVGDDLRVGWLRPEQCEVGTNLYATPVAHGEPVHFYRQRGGGGHWIECDTDPRERFANSPAALCMEYRTLHHAAPVAPSQQQTKGSV